MDPLIGQIDLFPYNYAPIDWILCDGRILQVNQYNILYSLLGCNFGGNGSTTFGIPDLTGASPIQGTAYYIAMNGIYPQRSY